jgi:hypothetical protein
MIEDQFRGLALRLTMLAGLSTGIGSGIVLGTPVMAVSLLML